MSDKNSILIIAGEVSGDMHGSELVRELRNEQPDTVFFGIGGKNMRDAGVDTLYGVSQMAVMGISEVLAKYSFFRKVFNEVLDQVELRNPVAAILIDYPGFNLRLADELHARGIKVIYYVSPQVWAWHRSRIKKMERIIDLLITIFPFEKAYFDESLLKVEYAGHPLVNKTQEVIDGEQPDLPWKSKERIAILPGSRAMEIARIFPVMWAAAARIGKDRPDASFIIAAPSKKVKKLIDREIKILRDGPSNYEITIDQTYHVLCQANAAMVASGTATVETALLLCPMIIAYKTSAITYFLGRLFIKIPHIGMVNVIAKKEICPEFIQGQASSRNLANAITPLLEDTPERKTMVEDLKKVREELGSGNAARKAARAITSELNR